MSATTIEVPTDQLDALRESLATRRGQLADDLAHGAATSPSRGQPSDAPPEERIAEIDDLLAQMAGGPARRARTVALGGARGALWSAAYDNVCTAAEHVLEECNEYWTGTVPPTRLRGAVATLAARFELLAGMGVPSGRAGS
jgi:hypothetical protein